MKTTKNSLKQVTIMKLYKLIIYWKIQAILDRKKSEILIKLLKVETYKILIMHNLLLAYDGICKILTYFITRNALN